MERRGDLRWDGEGERERGEGGGGGKPKGGGAGRGGDKSGLERESTGGLKAPKDATK